MPEKFKDSKHRDKIIDRIRKILAIANRTTFEGEANTAFRMAKGLMSSYGLELSEIDLKEKVNYNITRGYSNREGKLAPWERFMAMAIEKLCDTKLIINELGRNRAQMMFIGLFEDVELSVKLFDSFYASMKRIAYITYGDNLRRKSFLLGIAYCLCDRAEELTKVEVVEQPKYRTLMVIKTQAIDDYVKENIPNLKYNSVKFNVNSEAFDKGYKKGKEFDLGIHKKVA